MTGEEGKGSFPSFPTCSSAWAEGALLEQAEKLLCENQGQGPCPGLQGNSKGDSSSESVNTMESLGNLCSH